MRQTLIASVVVSLGLVFSVAAVAGGKHHGWGVDPSAFIGLWNGIDTLDGSTQQVSITCSHRRVCDVRINDTSFLDCDGRLGFARGEGRIRKDILEVPVVTLTCLPVRDDDVPLSDSETFAPDPRNGTLILDDGRDTPIVLHRISK